MLQIYVMVCGRDVVGLATGSDEADAGNGNVHLTSAVLKINFVNIFYRKVFSNL